MSEPQVLRHPPKSHSGFWLSKIDNKRYHSNQYQEDAHQIIEDFWKNHYDDTEDKGNDSSDQT
jgi:hypothetical protein